MASLKGGFGEVEVRIRKTPFLSSEPIYFEEYAKLGDREKDNDTKILRYLVPEDTTFAFEITLKKGFKFGSYDKVMIRIVEEVSKKRIFKKAYKELAENKILPSDIKIEIKSLKKAIVDGEYRKHVELSCNILSPDSKLSQEIGETDVGCNPSDLGGFRIEVCLIRVLKMVPKSKERWEKDLEKYRLNKETLSRAEKVDEKSFEKDGITHRLGLKGGSSARIPYPDRYQHPVHKDLLGNFHYIFRDARFLERNSIVKTPTPLEFQPWWSLKTKERETCFRLLQAYDKDKLIQRKSGESAPNNDPRNIERHLQISYPILLRPWAKMWIHEREEVFQSLQLRRKFWDRGETPPDPRNPGNSRNSALSIKDVTSQASAESPVKIKAERVETPSIILPQSAPPPPAAPAIQPSMHTFSLLRSPVSAFPVPYRSEQTSPPAPASTQAFLQVSNPVRSLTSALPNLDTPEQKLSPASAATQPPAPASNPIPSSPNGLSISDPPSKENSSQESIPVAFSTARNRVHEEISVIEIDDDDDDDGGPPASDKHQFGGFQTFAQRSSTDVTHKNNLLPIKSEPGESEALKRIKIEPGVAPLGQIDDTELDRLKQEEKDEEEELRQAQMIAEMMKQRKERKARIAAIEARRDGTSSQAN